MTHSDLRPPDPDADWPEVTFGGLHTPYTDRSAYTDQSLISPKTSVLFGTVAGLPWSLNAMELRDEGPTLEFFLGGMGEYGGGQVPVWLPEGEHVNLRAQLFGSPVIQAITAYVAVLSGSVERLEVSLADGRACQAEVHRSRDVPLPLAVFFPPYGAKGRVTAWDAGGMKLDSHRLYEVLVPFAANTSVGHGRPAPEPGRSCPGRVR